MTERVLFRYDDPHGVGGPVLIRWQTGKSGSLIATAGGDGSVVLFTRQGVLQERIILQGQYMNRQVQPLATYILC